MKRYPLSPHPLPPPPCRPHAVGCAHTHSYAVSCMRLSIWNDSVPASSSSTTETELLVSMRYPVTGRPVRNTHYRNKYDIIKRAIDSLIWSRVKSLTKKEIKSRRVVSTTTLPFKVCNIAMITILHVAHLTMIYVCSIYNYNNNT